MEDEDIRKEIGQMDRDIDVLFTTIAKLKRGGRAYKQIKRDTALLKLQRDALEKLITH